MVGARSASVRVGGVLSRLASAVVVVGCLSVFLQFFSLFLVLCDLVLVKFCLAASRIVCKLFSS